MESLESGEPEQTRKLFVGGLDYTVTDGTLGTFFEQWGEIVDVVVIKNPTTKRSRGFGFVTYSQSSMVDRAMSNRPHNINGREVETKRAIPRNDIGEPNIRATVKKLFIFGIKEQSENDILEYFETFGNVVDMNIVTDKHSSKRKGYGFIRYDDTDSVDKVIFIKGHQVAGEQLYVRKAISRLYGAGYRRGGLGGCAGGVNIKSCRVNSQYRHWEGYHNRSNSWGGGYGNCGMIGGYGFFGFGSACMFNTNYGRAWQGVPQRWVYNNLALGDQRGSGWGHSQQPSNNLGPNQSYGPKKPYPYNNHALLFGNSRASYINAGYAGNGKYPGRQLYHTP